MNPNDENHLKINIDSIAQDLRFSARAHELTALFCILVSFDNSSCAGQTQRASKSLDQINNCLLKIIEGS